MLLGAKGKADVSFVLGASFRHRHDIAKVRLWLAVGRAAGKLHCPSEPRRKAPPHHAPSPGVSLTRDW